MFNKSGTIDDTMDAITSQNVQIPSTKTYFMSPEMSQGRATKGKKMGITSKVMTQTAIKPFNSRQNSICSQVETAIRQESVYDDEILSPMPRQKKKIYQQQQQLHQEASRIKPQQVFKNVKASHSREMDLNINTRQSSISGKQQEHVGALVGGGRAVRVVAESPNKTRQGAFHAKKDLTAETNKSFDLRKRQRFSESTSPMKNQRSFVLDQSNSNTGSLLSTSVGSEHQLQGKVQMLPRDHNFTKEQLMAKVRKEMQCVMDYIAQIHDKLGNGYGGYSYVFKKINAQVTERIRKEYEKRAFVTISRKLFSIYRFKIADVKATLAITDEDAYSENSQERQTKLADKNSQQLQTKFSSCIHYYKRDLSPVRENFPCYNIKTPYRQNFSNYDANMMSKDFKSSLLKSLGSNVKCIQTSDHDRRLSTYYNQQEVSTRKAQQSSDLSQYLPRNSVEQPQPELLTLTPPMPTATVSAYLRQKRTNTRVTFEKVPKLEKLNFLAGLEEPQINEVEEDEKQLISDDSQKLAFEVASVLEESKVGKSQKELQQSQNIDAVPEKPLTTFNQTSIDNMAVQQRTLANQKGKFKMMKDASSHRSKQNFRSQPYGSITANSQTAGVRPGSRKITQDVLTTTGPVATATQKLTAKGFGSTRAEIRSNRVVKLNKAGGVPQGNSVAKRSKVSSQATKQQTVYAQKDISRNNIQIMQHSSHTQIIREEAGVVGPSVDLVALVSEKRHSQLITTTKADGSYVKTLGGNEEEEVSHPQLNMMIAEMGAEEIVSGVEGTYMTVAEPLELKSTQAKGLKKDKSASFSQTQNIKASIITSAKLSNPKAKPVGETVSGAISSLRRQTVSPMNKKSISISGKTFEQPQHLTRTAQKGGGTRGSDTSKDIESLLSSRVTGGPQTSQFKTKESASGASNQRSQRNKQMLAIHQDPSHSRFNKSIYAHVLEKNTIESLGKQPPTANLFPSTATAPTAVQVQQQQQADREGVSGVARESRYNNQITVVDQQVLFNLGNHPMPPSKHQSEIVGNKHESTSAEHRSANSSVFLPSHKVTRKNVKRDMTNKATLTGIYSMEPASNTFIVQKKKNGTTLGSDYFNAQRRNSRQKAISQVSQLNRNIGEITHGGTDSKHSRLQAATEFAKKKLEAGTVLPPASRQQATGKQALLEFTQSSPRLVTQQQQPEQFDSIILHKMQQSEKAERYLGNHISATKLPLKLLKSRDFENDTGLDTTFLSQSHYFRQMKKTKQPGTMGDLLENNISAASVGVLSPEKRSNVIRPNCQVNDQLISFSNYAVNDTVMIQATDDSESGNCSGISTKAAEKQQQLLHAGAQATQQIFFNQRVQNRSKLLKPRNVNLKQIWGLRASLTGEGSVGLEDSKASLLSGNGAGTTQTLIISPSKVLQQQVMRGERQSNNQRVSEHGGSSKLRLPQDPSCELNSLIHGNAVMPNVDAGSMMMVHSNTAVLTKDAAIAGQGLNYKNINKVLGNTGSLQFKSSESSNNLSVQQIEVINDGHQAAISTNAKGAYNTNPNNSPARLPQSRQHRPAVAKNFQINANIKAAKLSAGLPALNYQK